MHKAAESVDQILEKHFSGEINWTVSMEQEFRMSDSGFLLGGEEAGGWVEETPEDLRALGWAYVPMSGAPTELMKCFDPEEARVTRKYGGMETVALLGGLNGSIEYVGIGLTPLGKEKEAEVSQMLASRTMVLGDGQDGQVWPDVIGLLRGTAELPE